MSPSDKDKKDRGINRGAEFLLTLSSPGALMAASFVTAQRQKTGLQLTEDEGAFAAMPLNLTQCTDEQYRRFRSVIEKLAAEVTLESEGR